MQLRFFIYSLVLLTASCSYNAESDQSNNIESDRPKVAEDHDTLGRKLARQQLQDLLQGKGQEFLWDTLIKDSATAVAIAEPILFNAFGRSEILNERPYEVYLIDGYWYLSGTIPKGWKGGGFEIIFSAKDGQIKRLTHYK
ncbi:MAG: NTF2 fold immunity protein [Sediminibacterium sp.]